MPATVLAVLKVVFLIFLYLFIARVVRAVWVEIFAERRTLTAETEVPAADTASAARGRRGAAAPAAAATAIPKAALSRREQKQLKKVEKQRFILKVVEPPEVRGNSYPVADEMTLGRAPGCAVPIDDTFASQIHARVFRRDGVIFIEDLGSTNGTYLNRKKVTGPMPISNRDRVQIGSTVLELQK